MTIALVTSAKAGGLNGGTTSGVDTTGATLLVMVVARNPAAAVTVSDSYGNTWTALTEALDGTNAHVKHRIYYAANPTVGTGHTFTISGATTASALIASAWSGVDTTSPFDVESGYADSSSYSTATHGAGTLTPTNNNSLVICGVAIGGAVTSFAAAGGNTLLDLQAFNSGNSWGVGASYAIQTTATALSSATAYETWTGAQIIAFSSAVFKAAATSATSTTLTGPSTGTAGSASTNFTAGANGTITGTVTVTPSDGGAGGTFTPSTVNISSGTPTATFTYTASSAGAKSITITNSGGLSNPGALTYTAAAAGSPTAGTASLSSATDSALNLTCTAASGGTSPYTYQWHRSTTANFTPGAGNVLSGATSLTYSDTTAAANTTYYYRLRVTDNASATADSKHIAGTLKAAAISIGFVGDSITAGYLLSAGQDPPTQVGLLLAKTRTNKSVTISNRGIPAAKTADWLSGGANLIAAKVAFASAVCTHIHIMLGANDAGAATLVSAATYGSNLSNICTDLTGAGYKVILSYPTYICDGANSGASSAASVALAQSYQAQIDALINGTTILRGDTLAWPYFQDAQSEYLVDQVHPSATGAVSLATMWARAIDSALSGTSSSATGISRGRAVNQGA